MALFYIWSGATGSGTGASWANAFTHISDAYAAGSAGDTFFVAQDHSETTSGTIALGSPGTIATPCATYCVNRAGSVPPVSADLRTTAIVATTGASIMQLSSPQFNASYYYGIIFNCGSGANNSAIAMQQCYTELVNCQLNILATTAASCILVGDGDVSEYFKWTNTTVKFGAAGQSIVAQSATFHWGNTQSAIVSGTLPTVLVTNTVPSFLGSGSTGSNVIFDGIDFSALGTGHTIIGAFSTPMNIQLINCERNGNVTTAATPTAHGSSVDVIVCDPGATACGQERHRYEGTLTQETTVILTGGASDGVTPISWKIVSTSHASWLFPFDAFTIAEWNGTIGTTVTVTVEILNDGTTLNNDDIWIEARYLGNSSFPLASSATSGKADGLATGVPITSDSGANWVTTGITSPVKQKMVLTCVPQIAGDIRVVVKVGKASKTIYVNPLVELS